MVDEYKIEDQPSQSSPSRLQTALLLHETPDGGSHHDWLLVDPNASDHERAPLWTARVAPASDRWAEIGRFELQRIAHHRLAYVTYEGPVSGGRGTVRRIDEGGFTAIEWTEDRIVLDLKMKGFQGRITLRRLSDDRWEAVVG